MICINGDNIVASRNKLQEYIAAFKDEKKHVSFLSGKKATIAEIEAALQPIDLFGTDQVIVIEELFSRPHSKKRTEIIDALSRSNVEILLWDKKSLTPAQKKQLKPDQEFEYKTTKKLFLFLDTLSPLQSTEQRLSYFEQVIEQESAYLFFVMLLQRIRQLLILSEGNDPGGAPFMVSKLKSQAKKFSQSQLEKMHQDLYNIDVKTKTEGQKQQTLEQQLRLVLLSF